MNDRRRLRWKSGRLVSTPLAGFWAPGNDPQIPNLPLESPAEAEYIPRGLMYGAVLATVLASWSPPGYSATDFPTLTEEGAAPAAEVVPARSQVNDGVIARAWERFEQPQQRRLGIAAFAEAPAAADQPRPVAQPHILAAWNAGPWSAQRKAGWVESVDQPAPRAARDIGRIVDQWAVAWAAQRSPVTQVSSVDQPAPFGYRYLGLDQWAVTWGAQKAPQGPIIEAAAVDDPPRWTFQKHIFDAWVPPVYSVVESGTSTEEGAGTVADQPWPGNRWLAAVIERWRLDWSAQDGTRKVTESGAAPVENVPFKGFQAHILRSWEQVKFRGEKFGAAIELPVEQVAYRKDWLYGVVEQWKVEWGTQTRNPYPQEAVAVVDDPPARARSIEGIVAQWAVTWGTQRLANYPESGPVVEEQVPYSRFQQQIIRAWEPPVYSVISLGTLGEEGAAPAVGDVPAQRFQAHILRAWEPARFRGERFGAVIDDSAAVPPVVVPEPPRYYGGKYEPAAADDRRDEEEEDWTFVIIQLAAILYNHEE